MSLGIQLPIILFLLGPPPNPHVGPSVEAQQDPLFTWVSDVSMGAEYSDSHMVTRWVKSPTLQTVGANAEQQQVVADAVEHLNTTLALTPIKRIRVLSSARSGSADIVVHFAPQKDHYSITKRQNIKYFEEGNYSWFTVFYDGRGRIYRAYILIATDKLEGEDLRHHTLEMITNSLGPCNSSSTYKDSIHYTKGDDGGNAQQLSHKDEVLIWLIFNFVEPGSAWAEVRNAYLQHWPKEYR